MTPKELDEIEAQLDSAVPYYLPRMIQHARQLQAECSRLSRVEAGLRELVVTWRHAAALEQRVSFCADDAEALLSSLTAPAAETEEQR